MKSQKGFTLVEGILILLVFALIGAGGYFVWSRNKDNTTASNQTSQSTQDKKDEIGIDTPEPGTVIDTVVAETDAFSVEIPRSWNKRDCSNLTGFVLLATAADGKAACKASSATWPETSMASYGKVAIAAGVNPYPRQDFSSGTQKDLYESDAEDIVLSTGQTAKKFTYAKEYEKGKTFKVVEYNILNVTVYVFEGHPLESEYVDAPSTTDVVKIVENTIMPTIKKL